MLRAYEEFVDFIAAGVTPAMVAQYEASASVKDRVAELIRREKLGELSSDETSELEQYLSLEHVMRLAKARAAAAQAP